MNKTLLAAAIVSGLIVGSPVMAEKPDMPMKEKMEHNGKAMKDDARKTAEDMKQSGEEAADDASDDADGGKRMMEDNEHRMREHMDENEDDMNEHAGQMHEQGEDMMEDDQDKSNKAVPPGLAKKDQHPSTGKGSEQGQEARQKQEKPWWNFWD